MEFWDFRFKMTEDHCHTIDNINNDDENMILGQPRPAKADEASQQAAASQASGPGILKTKIIKPRIAMTPLQDPASSHPPACSLQPSRLQPFHSIISDFPCFRLDIRALGTRPSQPAIIQPQGSGLPDSSLSRSKVSSQQTISEAATSQSAILQPPASSLPDSNFPDLLFLLSSLTIGLSRSVNLDSVGGSCSGT